MQNIWFWVQMMQDWLEARKVDRKLLAALSANVQAFEAYQEYCAYEASNVLGDMVDLVCQNLEETPASQAEAGAGGEGGKGEEIDQPTMQEAAQTMSQLPLQEAEKVKAEEEGNFLAAPSYNGKGP